MSSLIKLKEKLMIKPQIQPRKELILQVVNKSNYIPEEKQEQE